MENKKERNGIVDQSVSGTMDRYITRLMNAIEATAGSEDKFDKLIMSKACLLVAVTGMISAVVSYDEDFSDELTEMANDLCRVISPMVATRIEEYLEQKGILHDD